MYQEPPTRKCGLLPLLKSLPCFLDGPAPIVEQTVELGATKSCEVLVLYLKRPRVKIYRSDAL